MAPDKVAASMTAIRGPTITFTSDPFLTDPASCLEYCADSLILVSGGIIQEVGPYDRLCKSLPPSMETCHYKNCIICPGFIDAHVHYPQIEIIGSFGDHLLEWLEKYTFPAERRFSDRDHSSHVARFFLRELLRAGTTTAAVYCTVHSGSCDAFFEESVKFNTRMIAGKVLMDRNAPSDLLDATETGDSESRDLIERWHGKGRQLYCITPRFAASSTEAQLEAAGRLWAEHPGTFLQTHLCESTAEIDWVRSLFSDQRSYLDVYRSAGLVGRRAIFGHAIHMTEQDFSCCYNNGSALVHCPTSNLFLGSGLFRAFDAKREDRPVRVGLGTDIGAGTSLCHLETLGEAYKVAALNDTKLSSIHAFYLATRGGAEALYLDDKIGSLAAGYEADMVVFDLAATPLLDFRMQHCNSPIEKLFLLMTLGDDRMIRATYVAGHPVYDRNRVEPFSYPPLR